MNIESVGLPVTGQTQLSKGSEQINTARKKADDLVQSDQAQQQVQPEELLSQINALTEDGLYSVRFEHDERTSGLIVKVVDQDNGDVIRQVPAEELLDLKVALDDLRGNMVDATG